MRIAKFTALCLLATSLLLGCGKSNNVSKEQAQKLAVDKTPARQVTGVDVTPLPVKWIVNATDAQGRPVAVWVSDRVEGFIYLDQGVTPAAARKAFESLGRKVIASPVIVGPETPYWYLTIQDATGKNVGVRVDFSSGQIMHPKDLANPT